MCSEHSGEIDEKPDMVPKRRKGPGLFVENPDPKPAPKKANSRKTAVAKSGTAPDDISTQGPKSSATSLETATALHEVSSVGSKSKPLIGSDPDMATVASKHTGSTKCLDGFQVIYFLEEPRDGVSRHGLGAKLRGVAWF